MRDPKIHWFSFDCHHVQRQDNFTNARALVSCGICLRHMRRMTRFELIAESRKLKAEKKEPQP